MNNIDKKKEGIIQMLNHCMNNAMCGNNRIKGVPNSNIIAEFINDWCDDHLDEYLLEDDDEIKIIPWKY